MLEITTVLESESIEPAAPLWDVGATAYWQDYDGSWRIAEIIDTNPRGFGYCTIQWQDIHGNCHKKSVPFMALRDLDQYIEAQDDYGAFEAADVETEDDEPYFPQMLWNGRWFPASPY